MKSSAVCIATVLSLASSIANAASFAVDLSTGSSGFANTPTVGAFADTYTFTLVAPGTIRASVIAGMLGNQDVDFTSIQITGPSGTPASLLNPDPFETWGLDSPLGAGSHSLTLQGFNGSGIGSYGGNLALATTVENPLPASGVGGPLDLSSGSTGFARTPAAGSFSDTFTFRLGSPAVASGAITTAQNGNQDVDFTSIFVAGPGGVFAFTQLLPDPYESWVLPAGSLIGAGSYTLTLNGTNSTGQGSYGGTFATGQQAVEALPEPDTAGLMLISLAACSLVRRRRSTPDGASSLTTVRKSLFIGRGERI